MPWAGRPAGRHDSKRWAAFRAIILFRDGRECQLRLDGCHGHANTVDHIVPLIDWPEGMYVAGNCQAACGRCNSIKKNTPAYYLPRPATPSRDW